MLWNLLFTLEAKTHLHLQIAKIIRMAGLMKLEVYLGEPGLANSIQAFEMTFAGDKGDSYSAFSGCRRGNAASGSGAPLALPDVRSASLRRPKNTLLLTKKMKQSHAQHIGVPV